MYEVYDIGSYTGNEYYGNNLYVENLKLLCPSISGLQKILEICAVFFKWLFCEI